MQIVFGIVLGLFIASTVMVFAPTAVDVGKKALTECEASLPRNQVCEIYAKPKEGK